MFKYLPWLFLFLVGPVMAADQEGDYQYFLDHKYLKAGETFSVDYKFPSPGYYINCHSDGGGYLGSVEYSYKGNIFKAQFAADNQTRHIDFVIGGGQHPYLGYAEQSIDESGTLTFTNLGNERTDSGEEIPLGVTCSYDKFKKN